MSRKYNRLIEFFESTPWAIMPEKLEVMRAILSERSEGIAASAETIKAAVEAREASSRQATKKKFLSVVPLVGVITPRASLFSEMSGMRSVEVFKREFDEALSDDRVSQVLIDVDSPGGSTSGVHELSEHIYNSRGEKPIVAHANCLMCSAAYYIASAADEIIASPTAIVGSIGVYTMHVDQSELNKKNGFKVTMVSAGRRKLEGNPNEALSEEARENMQDLVDEFYDMFVVSVARNRGVSERVVREGYAEGGVLVGDSALRENLVDRVESFDQTISRLVRSSDDSGGRDSGRAEGWRTGVERQKLELSKLKSE